MPAPTTITAFESITVSTAAIGGTAATYAGALGALIDVESAAIRYRVDGTDPTASVGHQAEVGERIILESANEMAKFKAIRRDGSDATLRVSYGS